jgi:nicotinamidase-related amidase
VPVDLAELLAGRALPGGRPVDPHDHPGALPFAVLTMEIQRGVMGDLATFPDLAAAAASSGLVGHTARLLRAVRAAGVPVVHCVAEFRADRAGTVTNTPLHSAVRARPEHLLAGTPATELVPELGVEETDLVSRRRHGVSPFTGTDLHATFSNLGVRVLVVTGVSLNLGIIGTCVEAVNLGYQVIVPTDAVTGIPADYAAAVVANTLALVATLTTVDELVGALQTETGVSGRRA